MSLGLRGYKTKTALKAAKGQELNFVETSFFNAEYPSDGNGTVTVVGPSERDRKWFAQVTLANHKITKVV